MSKIHIFINDKDDYDFDTNSVYTDFWGSDIEEHIPGVIAELDDDLILKYKEIMSGYEQMQNHLWKLYFQNKSK
jgi:hypothetical protein